MLVLTLWLTTRPYLGIVNDSRFYTVQVLDELLSGRFSNDLYFQYGSQDQFTIFTKIYAPFIAAFGLSRGTIIPTILSQALWLSGAAFFIHSIVKKSRIVVYAVAALVVLPGGSFFHYGESFLTPRIVTEALTFWALGCMVRRRLVQACSIFFLAILVHPLMALPGVAFFFLFEAIRKPLLWIVAILGIIAVFALALLEIQPFSRLLISFDPTWLSISEQRDFWCFISKWNLELWTLTLNPFLLGTFVFLYLKGTERLLLMLALTVAIGGILATFIGGDLLHNVLVVDAQQWRGIWLLSAVTNFFVGRVLFSSHEQETKGIARTILLLAAFSLAISNFVGSYFLFVTPICMLGLLVYWVEHKAGKPLSKAGEILVVVFLAVILAFALIALKLTFFNMLATPSILLRCLASLVMCAVAVTALVILSRKSSTVSRFLLYLSALLLAVAVTNWDQRTPWTKFIDTTTQPPADLVAALPTTGAIYWEGDVTAPWFLLKRTSQFSCDQGTGVLFSRGTAIAYEARYRIFARLGTLDFRENSFCPLPSSISKPTVTLKNLTYVCQKQPNLGALVLTTPAPNAPARLWTAPVEFQATTLVHGKQSHIKTDKFYIYRCNELLHSPTL